MLMSAPALRRLAAVALAAGLPVLFPSASLLAAGAEPAPSPTAAVEEARPTPVPTAAPTPTVAPTVTPVAAKCPLGATPQEIVRLYGPVLKHNARVRRHIVLEGGTTLDGDLHGRNGLIIRVVYHDGHVVMLEYTRVAGALTAADVKSLLDTLVDGSAWVQGKDSTDANKFFRRTDDRAVANYSVEYDGSLLVAAEGFDHDKLIDNLVH